MTSARREHLKKLQKAYLARERKSRRGKYTQMLQQREKIREQYPESEYDVAFKGEQATVTLKPEVAEARWQEEVRAQYPAAYYQVAFVGGEAQVTERQVPSESPRIVMPPGIRQLEPEARQEWMRREQLKRQGVWTPPKYKGVTKRMGSLAEWDVPYDIQERVTSRRQLTTPSAPTLFADYMKAKESAPPALFAEYMKTKGMEKTVSEQFWEFMTEPRITRYEGYGEKTVLGSPVGGGVVARTMTHFVKTGEATVGEVEEHVLKQPTIRSDLMSPEELAFTYGVVGLVLTVKAAPKITRWFSGTRVGEAIKFSRVAKAVKTFKTKLPAIKGSRVDVWLAKHSKLYYEKTSGIARGEVAQKVLPPKGVSLGELKWSERYWRMIQAPRTGGVMIAKSQVTTKGLQTYTFEWLMKGGQLVPRFRPQRVGEVSAQRVSDWQKYWQPERGLTPFVTQTQLTRMGVHPYRAPYVGGRAVAGVSPKVIGSTLAVLGAGLTKKLRFKPKIQLEWQPTLAREREKFRTLTLEKQEQRQKQLLIFPRLQRLQLKHQPLRQIYRPKLRKKEALVPALTVPALVMTKQEQKQLTIIKPVQAPKYVYPPKLVPPTLTPPTPPFRIPRGGADVSRGAKDLFGRWFKRTHPIKSAREMWRTFAGKRNTKGRRKKGGASLRF